jgi:hypothetical protein
MADEFSGFLITGSAAEVTPPTFVTVSGAPSAFPSSPIL